MAVMTNSAILVLAGVTREELGRRVRARWIEWARIQPHPKRSWLVPYDQLSVHDQEADNQIGEDLFCAGWLAGHGATGGPGTMGRLLPGEQVISADTAREAGVKSPGTTARIAGGKMPGAQLPTDGSIG